MTLSGIEVRTERLRLVLMTERFMTGSLEGRADPQLLAAGAVVPPEWPGGAREILKIRLEQVRANPGAGPWLLRAMLRLADGVMVGYINFHGPPVNERAELGYTVFEPHRGQGYATEAAVGMMRWARDEHGVRTFVVSISPDNGPSLRIAQKLGFEQVGSQIDEEDGLELIFELPADALAL